MPDSRSALLKTWLRITLALGLPFALLFGGYLAWRFDWSTGLQFGSLGGLLLGLLVASFSTAQQSLLKQTGTTYEDETILKQAAAQHMAQGQRSGLLLLTPTRLVFRSYGTRGKAQNLEIALHTIKTITPVMLLGFIPHGISLSFHAKQDPVYFAVHKRQQWLKAIQKQQAHHNTTAKTATT